MPAPSKSDTIREIIRCGKDPCYFIRTHAKIQHPIKGLLPFKTFPYQDDAIKAFLENRFNIILKGRQLGFTTIVAAFIAWFIIFNRDKNVLIVSTKADTAKTTIRIIRTILKYIPKHLMLCRIDIDNRQSIELSNGSRVKAITTSADAGRSEAVSLLFVDEVAHIDTMDELWTGIWPVLSAGGRAILSSTPKGTANFFYRTYKQAQNYENNFNCRFGTYVNPDNTDEVYSDRFPWWVHPEHDKAWFDHETAGKSARDIAQEYECNFNTSGDTFLPGAQLQLLENGSSEPMERAYDDRNFWVWQLPEKYGVYLICCDVASGFAQDFSAFHVIRIDRTLEQVAEYKGKLPADHLGELLMKVSMRYNNATIAPENNSGWSGQAIQRITDANYPYLYWSPRRKGEMVDIYNESQRAEALPGYRVTNANRGEMLAKVEQYIRNGDIILHSMRLVDEFKQFIWKNGRPEAARSAHDDLIMALAGGIWIREEAFMATYRSADTAMAMVLGMSCRSTESSQFQGFHSNENQQKTTPAEKQCQISDGQSSDTVDLMNMLITTG